MRWILLFSLLISISGYSQLQNYILGIKGDTLNGTDKNGKKQGRWVIKVESLRGESGYDEEGEFKNDRKEGAWRRYSSMGDLMAIENYRWGLKDGSCSYYSLSGGLIRVEGWMALDPEKEYDTIDVENVDAPNTFTRMVVKNEGASLKHGNWKFFDPSTGFIDKTEFWHIGKLDDKNEERNAKKKNKKEEDGNEASVKKIAKPKEVRDFEKKNSGKKKVKFTDGSVNGSF